MYDVAVDKAANTNYVAGFFSGALNAVYNASFTASTGLTDAFIAKYDAVGTVLWAIKFGGTGNDAITSIDLDPTGNIYVTGYFSTTVDFDPSAGTFNLVSTAGQDIFIAKYTSAGAFVWATKGSSTGATDQGNWIDVDANGVYVTGKYQGVTTFNSTNLVTVSPAAAQAGDNIFLVKYDLNGVAQWATSAGSNLNDVGYSVTADANRVYLIGEYQNILTVYNSAGTASATTLPIQTSPNTDICILAYTQAGAISWITNASSTGNDQGRGITNDGTNIYITGGISNNAGFPNPFPVFTQTVVGGTDLFVAKMNSTTGVYQWERQVPGVGAVNESGNSIVYHNLGKLYVTGYYNGSLVFTSMGGPTLVSSGSSDVFIAAFNTNNSLYYATSCSAATGADISYGIDVNNFGDALIGGNHPVQAITFAPNPALTAAASNNIFVAKCGCGTVLSLAAAGSDQTVCATSATMAANTPTNGSGNWSLLSGAGTVVTPGSPTSQITGLGLGANQFIWTISGSGCTANTDTVRIWRELTPSTSNAGPSQSVCATAATMAANTPTTGTGLWTLVSGAGTITTPSSPTSGITGLGIGANVFQWTISYLSCPPSISTMTITRYAPPTPANAGVSQTVCSTAATIAANTTSAGIGTWSLLSGTATITSPNSNASGITGLGVGTSVFQWQTSNGVCAVSNSTMSITRDAPPTAANAGPSQSVCATTATMAANTTSAGVGFWSLLSGTATITNPNLNTTSVTGLGVGTSVFQWQTSNGVCPATTSTMSITRYAPPTPAIAGISQTVCSTTATMAANSTSAGVGTWSLLSGTATITNPNLNTAGVTGLGVGTSVFQWQTSNGVCAVSNSTMSITRDAPPTAANAGPSQSVCAATATMAANTTSAGVGSWSLLSGTATITNPNLNTTSVTGLGVGTSVFQWQTSNGVCPATTSTMSITKYAPPTVASAGPNIVICATVSSVTAMAANTPTVGVGAWSLVSGSGVAATPNSPTSSIQFLSLGTNVFQWTISNGVCPSSSSTVAIVRDPLPTPSNAGANQNVCVSTATLNGNTPTVGTGLWTLVSGSGVITSPTVPNSVLTALATGTNVFQWAISNGACPPSTSTVAVIRDQNPTVSNAGSTQTLCSTTATMSGNTPVVGTGLWTLVSGGGAITTPTSPTTGITALSIGTNVFQWTVSNGTCPPSISTVAIVRNPPPTIANAGTSQTICTNVYTLTGNLPTVGTGSWTVISGTGTFASSTSPTTGVTGLSIGNNVYEWTIYSGVCAHSISTVTITVDAFPTAANAGSTQTICVSTATLSGNSPAIGNGVWSLVSGTGIISTPTSPNSGITGISTGTNVFQWTIFNGTCPPSTSTVAIIRDVPPTPATSSVPSQTICSGTATITGNTPAVGTGSWSVVSGTGSPSSFFTNTTSVTGISIGTETYQWSITNGACPASTVNVTVTRDQNPTISNAGTTQTVCSSSITSAGNAPAVGTGFWTLISGSGSITTPTSPTSGITGLSAGTNVFQWTISNGTCPPSTSTVAVIRDLSPTVSAAGSNSNICTSTVTLNGNSPIIGTGVWSLVSGSGSFTSPNSANSGVTGVATGNNVYQWTISNGVCPPSTSTIMVIKNPNPTISNAGSTQTICVGSATLTGNTPVIGTGVWNLVSGTGVITSPSSPTTGVTGVSTGTNIFQWTITNGTCPPSTSTVAIIRDQLPTIAVVGTNSVICALTGTLNGNTPTIGVGSWTQLVGTGSLATPLSNTCAVTGLGVGVNVFQWSISNGVCPASTSTVSITRDDNPTISIAGPTQTICATSTTLSANTPAVGTGSWSVVASSGIITNTTSPTTPVTVLGVGNNIFQWNISNGVCPVSTSTVNVYVYPLSTVANAGPNQTICSSTINLAGNTPTVGTGSWSILSGPGSITSPANPASMVTGLGLGTNVFQWTIVNGVCPPSISTVQVFVDTNPTTASVGSNQTICSTTVNLTGNNPAVGNGLWALVSGAGTIVSSTSPTSNVTGLGVGANVFQWTISNGTCPSSIATLTITRDNFPTVASAGINSIVCATSTVMAGNTPAVGTGAWTVLSGGSNITTPSLATSAVTNLAVGLNTFQWTISNGVCPATTSTVSIVRDNFPSASIAGPSQTLCASSNSTALSGNIPFVGTGTWSVIAGSAVITNSTNPFTTATSISTANINVLQWTISNGVCPVNTSTMSIQVDKTPSAAVITSPVSQTICVSTPSTTISGNTPAVGTGVWTIVGGSGTITSPNSPTTTVTGMSVGTTTLAWTISNGVCTSSTAIITIQIDAMPTAANAGPDIVVCSPSSTIYATPLTVGTGVWNVLGGGGTVVTPTSNATTAGTLVVGINTLEWVTSNGVCPSTRDTIEINVLVNLLPIVAGPDQFVCSLSTTLAAVPHAIATGTWVPLGSAPAVATPTLETSTVTFTNQGTYTYVWSVGYSTCPVENDTVQITTYLNPSISNAGADQTICSLNTTLNATIPSIGTGTWIPVGVSPVVATSTNNSTSVNLATYGTYTYVWSIGNGTCPTENDTVVVVANAAPSPANAGPDQVICSFNTNLAATLPTIGTGSWIPLVGPSSTVVVANSNTSAVSILTQGTFGFVWEVVNSSACPVTRDTMYIQTYSPISAGAANAGPDQISYVLNNLMTANTPTLGVGTWSVASGTGSFANTADPLSNFSANSDGVYTLVWTVTNGVCPAASDTIVLSINPMLIPQVITPNGDGSNDYFEIKLLANMDGVSLTIFNRWGNEVYKDAKYKNNFKGENNSGVKLADDTYFYILEAEGKTYTGYFAIKNN